MPPGEKIMAARRGGKPQLDALRQRAEAYLRKTRQEIAHMPMEDVQQLVHELQVCQVELELQNEELRVATERYSALYEEAPVGYLTLDDTGVVLEANPTAARLLGVARLHLMGARLSRFLLAAHADTFHLHRQRVRTSSTTDVCEVRFQCPDGRILDVRLESRLAREGQENLTHYRTVLIDVTEQKRAACALQQAHDALQRQMEEHARLQAQLVHAQKMQALGTLAGGIAHEFNNILGAMLGFTELSQYELPPDSKACQYLQDVQKAGKRARDLVQQILMFSRQTPTTRTPVQFHRLVQEALRFLQVSLPSTIELRLHLDIDVGTVRVDSTQMHQVLMNLCANAEYAMRQTGGILDVRLEAVEIEADGAATATDLLPGAYVRLTVRDTGEGMEPHVKERIFEPFFSTKPTGEGTGMGLALVHGIVTEHEGAITVESVPGHGTTFTLYLPRCLEVVPPDTVSPEPSPRGNERILFVDDEESLVMMMEDMLAHLGYEVLATTSSHEALKAFQAAPHGFDLVMTDLTMPNMTGESLARELRRLRPDIPIILCTGYSSRIDADQAATLGIDALLMKPWEMQKLAHTIQRVLAQRQSSRPRTET
jgi:PAS domain S-box-containing protein